MTLQQNYILGNAYSIVCHVPLIEGTIYKKNIHEKTEATSERIWVTPTNVGGYFYIFNLLKTYSYFLCAPHPKKEKYL